LLTVILLALGYSVKEVVIGNVVVACITLVVNLVIARRLTPHLVLPSWHSPTFRKLLRFGRWVAVSAITVPVLTSLEKVFLASWVSMSAVAFYTVPFNLTTKLLILPSALSIALFPFFSGVHGFGGKELNMAINLRVSRYIRLLLMPVTILLVLFGKEFLQLWMGPEFARESNTPLLILAIAMIINSAAWSPFALLQASDRPDLTAKFHLAELVLHVPLTLVCVQYWGVNGAALAWLIRVTVDTTLVWVATIKLNRLNWKTSLKAVFDRTVWIMITGAILFGILKGMLREQMSSLVFLITFGGSSLAVSALSVWIWGLGSEERQLIWRAFRAKEGGQPSRRPFSFWRP